MKCVDTCGCYDDEGKYYEKGFIFYMTHDGNGTCFSAICDGNITRIIEPCKTTTISTTPFTFTSTGKI